MNVRAEWTTDLSALVIFDPETDKYKKYISKAEDGIPCHLHITIPELPELFDFYCQCDVKGDVGPTWVGEATTASLKRMKKMVEKGTTVTYERIIASTKVLPSHRPITVLRQMDIDHLLEQLNQQVNYTPQGIIPLHTNKTVQHNK